MKNKLAQWAAFIVSLLTIIGFGAYFYETKDSANVKETQSIGRDNVLERQIGEVNSDIKVIKEQIITVNKKQDRQDDKLDKILERLPR